MKSWKRQKLNKDKYKKQLFAWRARKLTLPLWVVEVMEANNRAIMFGNPSTKAGKYQGLNSLTTSADHIGAIDSIIDEMVKNGDAIEL